MQYVPAYESTEAVSQVASTESSDCVAVPVLAKMSGETMSSPFEFRSASPEPSRAGKRVRSTDGLGLAAGKDLGKLSIDPKMSFRDKVMKSTWKLGSVAVPELDEESELSDEDVAFSIGEKGPSVLFSEKATGNFCKKWNGVLIIKLLGRSHSDNFLRTRQNQKWRLKGDLQLIDLDNDYYL
ncbi:hypothetical protein ACFX2I_000533 [Malus domestica]